MIARTKAKNQTRTTPRQSERGDVDGSVRCRKDDAVTPTTHEGSQRECGEEDGGPNISLTRVAPGCRWPVEDPL